MAIDKLTISKLKEAIPYKWKIQSFNKEKTKASCVAYIDARDVMEKLDNVIGPSDWQDKFTEANGKLVCSIGIKLEDEWVWKSDTGVESEYEKEKGQFSDAFKRAAVKWGIGRFLYDLEIKYIGVNQYKKPVDENGKTIWDLTEYFNGKKPKKNTVKDNGEVDVKKQLIWQMAKKLDLPTKEAIEDKAKLKVEEKNYDEILSRLEAAYGDLADPFED